MCNHFLPSNEDFHEICCHCQGQSCSKDSCIHCIDWSGEKWDKVHVYLDKLAAQCKRKRERKACFKSSSYFSGFSTPNQVPRSISWNTPGGSSKIHKVSLGSSSNENLVVSTLVSSADVVITLFFTSIM